jgi:NAD(P)-dependent dehydrogenase (short-subunit alcohol dehydrogenase family)
VTAVVMTGGTAGLGKVAVRRISAMPDTRLLLGTRTTGPASDPDPGSDPGPGERLPLDLSRLASVREFARTVAETLGTTPIDVLVLNAGIQQATNRNRTEDGFETTFAINHLAHYLLLRLLLPALAENATVVITTSDTHDPKTNAFGAPRDLDPGSLADPSSHGGFSAGFRAYAASKLCNLLTARVLAAEEPRLRVIAYNPGFTPGTALQRDWPLWARMAVTVGKAMRPVAGLATVEQAGDALVDLATDRTRPPAGRIYASLVKRRVTWPDPAPLAQRDDLARTLWHESARMAGLPRPD